MNFTQIKMGFELEFEGRDDEDVSTSNFKDFGNIHGDGSLNNGFELSSKVFTIEEFIPSKKSSEKWAKMFDNISNEGAEVRSTCGMHIHIDRQHLTPDIILKVNHLIYHNKNLSETIGERPSCNYSQFTKNSDAECKNARGEKYRFMYPGHGHGTIEFRFFKSTDNLNTFLKNMQSIISFFDFCKSSRLDYEEFKKIADNDLTVAYITFVFSKPKMYADLIEFLKSKKYYLINGEIAAERKLIIDKYPSLAVKNCVEKRLGFKKNLNLDSIEHIISLMKKAPNTAKFLNEVIKNAVSDKLDVSIVTFKDGEVLESESGPAKVAPKAE